MPRDSGPENCRLQLQHELRSSVNEHRRGMGSKSWELTRAVARISTDTDHLVEGAFQQITFAS